MTQYERCGRDSQTCRRRGRPGSATVVALLLMLVMTISGMGLAAMSLQSMRLARAQQAASVAFNISESGIERGIRYLRTQSGPPAGTTVFYPFGTTPIALGNGTYDVLIDPNDANPGLFLKQYRIRAVGRALGRQETIEAHVRMATLGAYAFLADNWPTSLNVDAANTIDGPFHINTLNNNPLRIAWSTSATSPIFRNGMLSVGNGGVNYVSPRAPNTEAEYQKIYQLGSAGYRTGVSPVTLPTGTTVQRDAAWGAGAGFPSTDGLYVPATGSTVAAGIYMRGTFDQLHFRIDGSGNQAMDLQQGSNQWTITVNRTANTTTVQKTAGTGSPTTTNLVGLPNGAIYCSGHINSMQGTLADSVMSGGSVASRNAYTVAVDSANGYDITVTGNIRYNTVPSNANPWDETANLRASSLGLIAEEVKIGATAPTTLRIDAIVVAGRSGGTGSFWSPAYNTKSPRGTVLVYGGVIANQGGATYTSTRGWIDSYTYDQRMRANPPPYFPPASVYERLSFRRVSAGAG